MRKLNDRPKNSENRDAVKTEIAKKNAPVIELHQNEPRWFAVHTRSKCEKLVRGMLEKKQIEAYVPLQKLMRRYSRSTRLVEKPLITCYVFVRILKNDYVPVLETENVAGFVRLGKDLRAIPEIEMDWLKRITMDKELDAEAQQGKFSEGDLVEIAVGNLAGMRGRVVEKAGKKRFAVELENIGYSILISLEAGVLLKVG